MKLHQCIALVAARKARTRVLTEAHHGLTEPAVTGLSRTYQPKDEEGDNLPPELKFPPRSVVKDIRTIVAPLVDYYDIVAMQEMSNCEASASVVVDGQKIFDELPVTVLLFIERQLTDLHTFLKSLPVLPKDKSWTYDSARGCFVTEQIESVRTQKVPEVIVKYPATPEHPAQTELFAKDVTVGSWFTTHLSTAVRPEQVETWIRNIEKLQEAVKLAREEANETDTVKCEIGLTLFSQIFPDLSIT